MEIKISDSGFCILFLGNATILSYLYTLKF